jgi:transcriptional regulator with XRE-family HTH domain
MALHATLAGRDTLPPVEDETTGQRIRRLRKDLGWRQSDLAAAAGVKVETVSNVERDLPAARGERPSVPLLEAALEKERQRQAGEPGPSDDRQLMEFLSRPDLEDVRIRRIGRNRKTRIVVVAVPDPDATPEEIRQDLEDFHREQRRGDGPNG